MADLQPGLFYSKSAQKSKPVGILNKLQPQLKTDHNENSHYGL